MGNARANLSLVADRVAHESASVPPHISDYQDWLTARGLSPNTIRQRISFVDARLADWGTLDMPAAVVVGWLMAFTGWTRRAYLSQLRSAYAWQMEAGLMTESPVARVRSQKSPPPKPTPLSDVQLATVMGEASGDLLAWLMLGAFAGLRCHEIAKVRGEDFTEAHLYVNGKGGVEAYLPTHPALWELAQTYPREGYWFPSAHLSRSYVSESQVGNKVRAHFRANGVESGAAHRLRHYYGTTLARRGVQPRILQELMRHASLETTMRYIAVDDAEKASAVRLLAA